MGIDNLGLSLWNIFIVKVLSKEFYVGIMLQIMIVVFDNLENEEIKDKILEISQHIRICL